MNPVLRAAASLAWLTLGACARAAPDPAALPTTGTTRVDAPGRMIELTGTTEVYVATNVIPFAPAKVFAVLPAVLTELGIPVGRADTTAMNIETRTFAARRRLASTPLTTYFDCGSAVGMPNAATYTLTITGWAKVEANEVGVANLRSHFSASAKPEGVASNPVVCTSTGRLETRVAELAWVKAGS